MSKLTEGAGLLSAALHDQLRGLAEDELAELERTLADATTAVRVEIWRRAYPEEQPE